jgi:hypothetical protein
MSLHKSKNVVRACVLLAITFPFVLAKAAHADYMSDYFSNGSIVKITTPNGFNVNLPYLNTPDTFWSGWRETRQESGLSRRV